MKRITLLVLILSSILISACNLSLAEDVTPPPDYIPPTPQPTLGPLFPASAPDLANGASIFASECAPCHGDKGLGDGPMSDQLSFPVAALGLAQVAQKASPAAWYSIVTQGNMARMMPPFSQKLSDQDRWDVVSYSLSLHGTELVAQGKSLFEKNCANCDTSFFTNHEKISSLSDDDLISLMLQGTDQFPAFGANLGSDELYAMAAYLRTLSVNAALAAATTTPAAAASDTTTTPAAEGTPSDAYPNPTSEAVIVTGPVHASVTVSNGALPADLTVTLRGYDHAQDSATGPQEVVTLEGKPAKDGALTFNNIELIENRILLVEAEYKGIVYQSDLAFVKPGDTEVTLAPLTLYDASTNVQALTVSQGHIFLDVSTGQVQIIELFSILNSTKSSIIVAIESEQMSITSLPEGTSSLGYDAQQGEVTPVDAPGGFAMPPSDKTYGLVAGYETAYSNSLELTLPFVLAMPEQSSIFVPLGVKLEGEGLIDLGTQDIGNGTMYQSYQFGPLPANSSLKVKLSGLPGSTPAEDQQTDNRLPFVIGLGVLGVLLIGGAGWLYLRDSRQKEEDDEDDHFEGEEEFEDSSSVLDAIIALDDLHRGGKIPEEAYQKRRAELKEQLKNLENKE